MTSEKKIFSSESVYQRLHQNDINFRQQCVHNYEGFPDMLPRLRRDSDSECCVPRVCDIDFGSELQDHQPLDVCSLQGRPGHVVPPGPDLAQRSGEVSDGEVGGQNWPQKLHCHHLGRVQ